MYSWQCSIHEIAPFLWGRGFWTLSHPNLARVCWNFVRLFYAVSIQSFKIKCLGGNKTYPKLTVLVHIWVQFTPRNQRYCQKPQVTQKIHPYDYQITQVSGPRWILQNSYKTNKKKNFFSAKNGLFKIKNRPVNKE